MTALSLRAKFLLIVMAGAVIPLAVVGWWLTGNAQRSGTELLRGQLETAIDRIAFHVDTAWAVRAGELGLLANNTVVQAGLQSSGAPLPPADSAWLLETFGRLEGAFAGVQYLDARGAVRWTLTRRAPVRPASSGREFLDPAVSQPAIDPTFPVSMPIVSELGDSLGVLQAQVRLTSVLAPEVRQPTVPGAILAAHADTATLFSSDSLNPGPRSDDPAWEHTSRDIASSPLRVELAAPIAPFVQPFERAARLGLGVLMAVALLALFVTAVLTARMTSSITRMAVMAEGIAGGNLQGRVEVPGRDELGRLGGAFNAMADSLRQTLAELSQQRALAAVGEFAASLSHDVRNSLTAIHIDLQHAARQLPDDNSAAQLVRRTLDTVRRLDSTVTGALRVARSGRTAAARVDLADLLRRALDSAEPSFTTRSATLRATLPDPGTVQVEGDVGALEQMFLNLLLNAAEVLAPGGSTVVEVDRDGDRVVVRVRDNGPGFAPGVLAAPAWSRYSTKPGGTGLGLPIARRIVTAHGGDLRIDSVEGAGATVTVILPAITSFGTDASREVSAS